MLRSSSRAQTGVIGDDVGGGEESVFRIKGLKNVVEWLTGLC